MQTLTCVVCAKLLVCVRVYITTEVQQIFACACVRVRVCACASMCATPQAGHGEQPSSSTGAAWLLAPAPLLGEFAHLRHLHNEKLVWTR